MKRRLTAVATSLATVLGQTTLAYGQDYGCGPGIYARGEIDKQEFEERKRDLSA